MRSEKVGRVNGGQVYGRVEGQSWGRGEGGLWRIEAGHIAGRK